MLNWTWNCVHLSESRCNKSRKNYIIFKKIKIYDVIFILKLRIWKTTKLISISQRKNATFFFIIVIFKVPSLNKNTIKTFTKDSKESSANIAQNHSKSLYLSKTEGALHIWTDGRKDYSILLPLNVKIKVTEIDWKTKKNY